MALLATCETGMSSRSGADGIDNYLHLLTTTEKDLGVIYTAVPAIVTYTIYNIIMC